MTNLKKLNFAASVKARLLNLARKNNRQYQELLQYFVMERFLYRLGESSYNKRFILKGALLLHVWEVQNSRATRDIDMLAITDNSPESAKNLIEGICDLKVDSSDGIHFDSSFISTEVMQSQRDYEGIRVHFFGYLETTKIPMQIDFGFGDKVTPAPIEIIYPSLLDHPKPKIWGYPVETVIAEKLHTMVEKRMFNSRVKDYHDVWILLRRRHYNEKVLQKALKRTFEQRKMAMDIEDLLGVITHYGSIPDRQTLWAQHIKKVKNELIPERLDQVCDDISNQLRLVYESHLIL